MTSLIGLSVFVSVYICVYLYLQGLYCTARGRFFPVATSAAPPFLNLGDPLCRAVKPASGDNDEDDDDGGDDDGDDGDGDDDGYGRVRVG